MNFFKYILLSTSLFCATFAQAQQTPITKKDKPVNQVDAAGKRDGSWLITTSSGMGEIAINEFGNYDHGNKIGKWYKVDGEGQLISIENYKNDVLDGEVRYYDRGHLSCIGHYRSNDPKYANDTVIVTDPITGRESLKNAPREKGTLRHGMWRFYNPETGKLVKEQEYQIDYLIYEKDFASGKEDSLYYAKRNKELLNKKANSQPPHSKQVSYLNF